MDKTNTGVPDNLRTGAEKLSGVDLSDVSVHHNSSKPAQLNATAYTQGSEIHLAPGQSQAAPLAALAHELWHVVQQKQGRVKPTHEFINRGPTANDDSGLEREAAIMGAKALNHING